MLEHVKKVGKFEDPDVTADGSQRARVALKELTTLWINTGTLCNITCVNCYIESSPKNDRLAYIATDEVKPFLEEAQVLNTREIGFTGGEPFLNPDCMAMIELALQTGFEVLVLTNAMLPMQRPNVKTALLGLRDKFGQHLKLRVSLDHYTKSLHEQERGANTFRPAIDGLNWLSEHQFSFSIAGRTCWNEDEARAREGYSELIKNQGWPLDAANPSDLILFPEMDENADVPEITTACWGILSKTPDEMMCSSSRMIVKRKGAKGPVVLPCTLLPYDERFEMASSLEQASTADGPMFDNGSVKLCHVHCAKFCVLGGGSCSA